VKRIDPQCALGVVSGSVHIAPLHRKVGETRQTFHVVWLRLDHAFEFDARAREFLQRLQCRSLVVAYEIGAGRFAKCGIEHFYGFAEALQPCEAISYRVENIHVSGTERAGACSQLEGLIGRAFPEFMVSGEDKQPRMLKTRANRLVRQSHRRRHIVFAECRIHFAQTGLQFGVRVCGRTSGHRTSFAFGSGADL
jgi:hypothetical protein